MHRHLLEAPVGRLFLQYLLPTVCATLVTAIYLFADTMMVGHRLGTEALAALNLIIPVEFCFFAVGSLLGNGGAVCFTRCLGLGDGVGARRFFATAVVAGGCFAALATALTLRFLRPLAAFVLGAGAEGPLLEATLEYGVYIAAGCPMFVVATLLAPFLRHDRAPRRAMVGVLSGGVANIVLDWVFMYPLGMGLAGAGLATALGATLTVAVMLTHFRTPGRALRWAWPEARRLPQVAHFGGGAFLQELSGCVTVLLFNRLALAMLGETGLVVYGVLGNDLLVMAALFNGVAQAAQPLVAANAAAGQPCRVRRVLTLALRTAGCLGALAALAAWLAPELFMRAFLPKAAVAALPVAAPAALAAGMLCLPFMGLGQVATLQLPALGRPTAGTLFAFLRNGALLLPIGLLLGWLLGPWRMWWAFLLAEVALLPFLLPRLRERRRAPSPNRGRSVL